MLEATRRSNRKRDNKLESLGELKFGLPDTRLKSHDRIDEMFRQQQERLSERGLVRRERSQTDRRSMVAFLTKEGEAVADKMYDSMRRAQDRFLAPLRPEFRAAFLAMVTELIEGNSKYSLPDTNSASARRKSAASRDK